MADLPEPLAQGELRNTPFAHVLLHIRKNKLTGSLVLWRTDVAEGKPRQDRIRFYQGAPVKAAFTDRASKIERGMLPLCARDSGPYAFYEGVDLVGEGDRVKEGKVDVLGLIAASLRGSSRDDIAAEVVRRFGDSMLRLHRNIDIRNMGLLPDERNTVDLLRAKPMTAAKLRKLSPLEPRMVLRLIYFLAITGSIEPWDGKMAQPGQKDRPKAKRAEATEEKHGAPDMPSDAPDHVEGKHRERWNQIQARVKKIEHENYFEMLGIDKSSSAEAAQTAYFGLVKSWHPDRLPPELVELRPYVERVFRYITRANETLSDTETRGQYLKTVQDGGGTPEKERELATIVDAAMEFRKVEVMMRRREYDAALAKVTELMRLVPDEGDYYATHAYLLFTIDGGSQDHRQEIMESLQKAIELTPNSDKAHYYKGMAMKRWGEQQASLHYFKKAAELNPKNIEAVREVRLGTMRGSIAPEPKKKGGDGEGIFGKLFGSSKKKKK